MPINDTLQLLTNATATGAAFLWPGGIGQFSVCGTFGGSTVTLMYLGPDGSTWLVAGVYTTLTAQGGGLFSLAQGLIKAVVNGGSPNGLFASAGTVQS